jgi:hypothetical protein
VTDPKELPSTRQKALTTQYGGQRFLVSPDITARQRLASLFLLVLFPQPALSG